MSKQFMKVVGSIAWGAMAALPAHAEMSAEELAKLAQNPVGNLISVPFQNNSNFNFGPLTSNESFASGGFPCAWVGINEPAKTAIRMSTRFMAELRFH